MLPSVHTSVTDCRTLVTRLAVAVTGNVGRPLSRGGGRTHRQRKGRAMGDSDEFAVMSDPDFLAERKRVLETLEALAERYRLINVEFDRRAGAQWASASRG